MHLVVLALENKPQQTADLNLVVTDWQTNGKHCTAPLAVLRNDLAAIRLDQLSRNREPEADTTGTSARTAIELLKYFCFLSRFETGAAIGHGNDQRGIIAGGANFNRAIAFAITHRVREQRIQRLLNQARIHGNCR